MIKYILSALFLVAITFSLADFALVNFGLPLQREVYLEQFSNPDQGEVLAKSLNLSSNLMREIGFTSWLLFLGGVFVLSLYKLGKKAAPFLIVLVSLLGTSGCMRPWEPVILKTIGTNESAFLIPLAGDVSKQDKTNSVLNLEKNQIFAKQVRMPQQWVPTGRDWFGIPNGKWQDSAVLIQVDRSPVTRIWTADTATGTSSSNQAIWVMTSDQVEFSTGWALTARIADENAAVKFLHNYRNETLSEVLDREVRAMVQTKFSLEVTDLPMDELRKNATPHLRKVMDDVTKFFASRGLEITTIGITGGFVYKDKLIGDKIVEVFNAEQEKTIAQAKAAAQFERNKQVQLEADGLAKALITRQEAEAKGIRVVAEAAEKAASSPSYLKIRELENQFKMIERWKGEFPHYYTSNGQSPTLLLSPNGK